MVTTETLNPAPLVSVIVPARNEEASLADCLHSLTTQTGVAFEVIVVDDHSTDRTREIATAFPGVKVIEASPLPPGWTGKNNAVTAGAQAARGAWLLFTDADTVHLPGSLAAALKEAQENGAELLSYSPEQIAITFWEMATLPVVFAELARQYSPSKVSDPASPLAAANGQYILIRRDAYDAVGGHAAIAANILEDVALARAVKTSGRKIRFRYGANAVRTRMYRNYHQLRDGWTKNLALLFPNPGWLAAKSLLVWAFPWAAVLLIISGVAKHSWWNSFVVFAFLWPMARLRRANFDWAMQFLGALFGMPMFAYLLLRSKRAHANGSVTWKGRTYDPKEPMNEFSRSSYRKTTLRKLTLALIIPTLLSLELSSPATSPAIRGVHSIAAIAQDTDAPALSSHTLIEPGARIGPLKLGDSRDRALELFPKKSEDQEWTDKCGGGTTLDWVDAQNPTGHGDLYVRLNKKGKIFQIESTTTRFRTAEGITIFDHADKVAENYKDLRAYTLLTPPDPSRGSRPLVYWIDKKNGIAFVFAYYPKEHKRYIYKIVVFEPNKNFCPEEDTTSSPKWQAIPSYALEPPPELAPNLN